MYYIYIARSLSVKLNRVACNYLIKIQKNPRVKLSLAGFMNTVIPTESPYEYE